MTICIAFLLYNYEHLLLNLFCLWWQRFEIIWTWSLCALTDWLPWRERFKVSEGLCELKWFVDDTFTFFVVANFGVSLESVRIGK